MKKAISGTFKLLCLFILSFLCIQTTWAQGLQISGTVLDKTGEAVIGASVLVKGTTNGTITDIDGNFQLMEVPAKSTLQVSYIGYKTEEIPLNGKTRFSVVLEDDTKVLDEVIVVGYGVQRKSDLTGADKRKLSYEKRGE